MATGFDRDKYKLEYSSQSISGITCLEITHKDLTLLPSNDKTKISKERKKEKDALGVKHQEEPILDCKLGKNGKEYCDAILYTNRVKEWDEVIVKFYENAGYKVDRKDIDGGVKRSISDKESLYVCITF